MIWFDCMNFEDGKSVNGFGGFLRLDWNWEV